MEKQQILEVGQILELEIGAIAHGGHFIARYEGRVIFVRYGITGERVRAQITQVSSKVVRADVLEVLSASPARVTPPCEYFGPGGCGGCDFQHIDLGYQRALKLQVLTEQFSRLGGIDLTPLAPDLTGAPGESGLHWRNRVDFALTPKGEIGFYRSRSKEVIAIKDCLIADGGMDVPALAQKRYKAGERISVISTSTGQRAIYQGAKQLVGDGKLTEQVNGYRYEVSPHSFWQGHRQAAEILSKEVIAQSQLHPQDVALDLYGGVGLFTAPMARKVGPNGQVIMVEMEGSSTQDAERNFAGASNVKIIKARAELALAKLTRADVIVLDPPRIGVDAQVIAQILRLAPRRVVYISCDPASLARDVSALIAGGYILERVHGLDLFPMTAHIESVVTLVHR
jgi:tRNA/tmRNA/rRNA uracil-C5-methylase (TrmA/RlmC/RlmD family)